MREDILKVDRYIYIDSHMKGISFLRHEAETSNSNRGLKVFQIIQYKTRHTWLRKSGAPRPIATAHHVQDPHYSCEVYHSSTSI